VDRLVTNQTNNGLVKMVEIIEYWTFIIAAITAFIWTLIKLVEALETFIRRIPKSLTKFLVYGFALVIPYATIIWWFFYLAGLSPGRLSEPRFFWAMVAQPTIGASFYGYAWGKWIYPRLHNILGASNPAKPGGNAKRTTRKKE
jgi:hypothetical protein